jgi:parallel beta-helix repeat protein
VDGRFLNNWIEGVGNNNTVFNIERPWPSDNGFFFEISKGAVCAGNVFVDCDHGIWVLNSSDVKIYNNTFVNSTACIARNERSAAGDHFGWHPSTGPDVDERDGHIFVNNLMTGDENFKRPLLYVWQPASLCEKINTPQLKQLDYNMYVRGTNTSDYPLILWSPAINKDCRLSLKSLEELRKLYPEFSAHSRYFADYNGPLFKSSDLGNYQLLETSPGFNLGTQLPSEIFKLTGQSKKYIGAYPLDR